MLVRFKMLMNKVDAGGPGAAPTSGEGTGGTTPPANGQGQQQQPANGQQPAGQVQPAKTFTQQEVNAIVEDRLARERAARGQPGQQAPVNGQQAPTQQEKPKPDAPVTRQEFEEWQRRSAFDKRVSPLGLSPAAEEDLWTLYNAQKPADPEAWFKSKQETLGLKGTQVPNTQNANGGNANSGTQGGANPPSAPNAGGKVNDLTSGGLVDIFNLPLDKVIALGPEGLRKHHEENLAAARSRDGAPPIPKMPAR